MSRVGIVRRRLRLGRRGDFNRASGRRFGLGDAMIARRRLRVAPDIRRRFRRPRRGCRSGASWPNSISGVDAFDDLGAFFQDRILNQLLLNHFRQFELVQA